MWRNSSKKQFQKQKSLLPVVQVGNALSDFTLTVKIIYRCLMSHEFPGYKVLQLTRGNASAYVHRTKIKKWDICAGNAILNSLHGRVSTLHDESVDYSDRSAPEITDGILATMENHDWFYQKLKSQ